MKRTQIGGMFLWTASAVFTTVGYAQEQSASASADAHLPSTTSATAKAGRKADRKLELAVRRELGKTKGVDVSNISVRAHGGLIVLSGTVASGEQIPRAEEVAKGVAGVISVTNSLSLSPENGS
jgi:hyperosmotically inducible protein